MNSGKERRIAFGKAVYDFSALIVCLVFLTPVIWAIFSAFQPSSSLFTFPPNFDLRSLSLANFKAVFGTGNVPRYAMNSLIVATTSSILTVIGSSMAGFALAKYRFFGRRFVFLLIISVLLIPLQVLMVPVFLILKTLGWINSLIGIIVPPAATATGTFMMRQYIVGIPDELLEAARIDGASDWKIYRHIILPLSAPALGAVGILSFTWRWNDYLWPLIVIGDQKNFTLQLSLANLVGTNTVEWGTLLAYATLAMLPVLVVFLCFQRYFLKGSLSGGVKG
ncbi:MAG TPA: carbohydrate ABC transporter permease [Chthoniobacterales bacterium]|jgi:alpha-1,4-digalacturonate transport system permease protein|nr:carbohydrate ABC transporter permease [Chthoniobacterales bacterium]